MCRISALGHLRTLSLRCFLCGSDCSFFVQVFKPNADRMPHFYNAEFKCILTDCFTLFRTISAVHVDQRRVLVLLLLKHHHGLGDSSDLV